jgi:hypothetical protein
MTILEKLSMRVFYAMYAFEALILPNKDGACGRVKTAWKIFTSK